MYCGYRVFQSDRLTFPALLRTTNVNTDAAAMATINSATVAPRRVLELAVVVDVVVDVMVMEVDFQIVLIGVAVVAFPRYPETEKPSSMVLRKL